MLVLVKQNRAGKKYFHFLFFLDIPRQKGYHGFIQSQLKKEGSIMDLMKKLKRETLVRILVPVLLLGLFGVVFLSGSNLFAKEPTPRSLYEVPRDELEGAYVTVDVDWIYGCYAYTEKYRDNQPTGEITQREYIIDANIDDYCALILDGSLMKQAEALLEECDAYYSGEAAQITKSFTVTGEMKALPSDSLSLYHQVMGYDSLSPAEQQIVLPLYLSPSDYATNVPLLIIGIVLLGAAAALVVMTLMGQFQKQLRQKLENASAQSPEALSELIGNMLKNVPAVAGLRIDGGYMLLRSGFSHFFYDSGDLVWAYQQVTRQKLYGIIPIGKTYALILKMADGTEKAIPMKQAQVKQQLETLMLQFPGCVIGYSDELKKLYRDNRGALRQVAAAQRAHTAQQ